MESMKIIKEIQSNIEPGEFAYIARDGSYSYGNIGCQPSNTQAIGYWDFLCEPLGEILEKLNDFMDME